MVAPFVHNHCAAIENSYDKFTKQSVILTVSNTTHFNGGISSENSYNENNEALLQNNGTYMLSIMLMPIGKYHFDCLCNQC